MLKKLLLITCVLFMNQLIAQDLPETDWTDYADTSWYDASLNDFEIDNAEGFAGLSVLVANGEDFENKSIRLTSNLDLGEHLWQPIGLNIENSFKGELDGQDHVISNLYINMPTSDFVGLFGSVLSASFKNLIIEKARVYGQSTVGALVANLSTDSHIDNCHVVEGYVLCDGGWDGGIGGGLVGGLLTGSSVIKSSFSGEVHGGDQIGGLVGTAWDTTLIEESYSEGLVVGDNIVGGLVGYCTWNFPPMPNTTNILRNSYSRANVVGSGIRVGGLYGAPEINALIENCYSTGSVEGVEDVGASIGEVIQETEVINVYFNNETSLIEDGIGSSNPESDLEVIGKTTEEMKTNDFVALLNADSESIWTIDPNENDGYPILSNITLNVNDFELDSTIKVYPTVSSSQIYFNAPLATEFVILDYDGKTLDHGIISSEEINYDVSHLQNGVYLVVFKIDELKVIKRFIKK